MQSLRASAPSAERIPARKGEFTPLELGSLEVWPPVVLAPMAGVTNYPFRSLCREFGAGLYVSEMITARGYLNGNRMTRLLASSRPDERPRSVQIYGSDPVDVGEAVGALVEDGVEHIDMNFGCPVPKVTRQGGGSAIPLKPRLLARLVRAAVVAAGEVPVTIKVRKGIDDDLLTFLDAGRVAEEEGAAAIGLHGRTAAELYAGRADWDAIGALVGSVSIPVLGNGDIWEAWDALAMMRSTGCAGVIVGRGCLGRPWLFRDLADVFDGRPPVEPPRFGRIVEIMRDHAERLMEFFGEEVGMLQMRKWASWYTIGFPGSAKARGELVRVKTLGEMLAILERCPPETPFPASALRAHRGKGGRTQVVTLPEGFLDDREDDTPPRSPRTAEEIARWERRSSAGAPTRIRRSAPTIRSTSRRPTSSRRSSAQATSAGASVLFAQRPIHTPSGERSALMITSVPRVEVGLSRLEELRGSKEAAELDMRILQAVRSAKAELVIFRGAEGEAERGWDFDPSLDDAEATELARWLVVSQLRTYRDLAREGVRLLAHVEMAERTVRLMTEQTEYVRADLAVLGASTPQDRLDLHLLEHFTRFDAGALADVAQNVLPAAIVAADGRAQSLRALIDAIG